MSGYTIKNLKDVEDAAVKFGLSPAMESRFARRDLGLEQVGLSYQRLAPDARQPFSHRHEQQEEVYVVTDGAGRVKVGDEVVELRRWDAVRVAPGTVRTFAAGPEGLELLAFGGGAGGMGDAEQLPDAWA
jgi:mannose-6-phosphate isomerase-like protein (cupin superfamily)